MTRINSGINPNELTDRHLLAEAREIKRVPNCVSRGRYNLKNVPLKFTLGKGHVSFFYNKLGYLKNRYEDIYQECKIRGFNVQYWGSAWDMVPKELMNDYLPTKEDREIITQRINERLNKINKHGK
jgi:hypothetical protein